MKIRIALLASAAIAFAMTTGASAGPGGGGGGGKGMHTPRTEGADLLPNAGRDALRQVVQNQCLQNWRQHKDPSPCERIWLSSPQPDSPGYAVLEDRKGGAHFLLIPIQTFSGTESGELLDSDLPNYFSQAWNARDLLNTYVGHAVPRTAVGLALSTPRARDQDQFHIHIECLRPEVFEALHANTAQITGKWSPITVIGSTYQARRIADPNLEATRPFELVAQLSPDAKHHLENYTVLISGMQYPDGAGFVILTSTGPTAELLLDPGCTVAGGGG
ncbi:MAG TPA: CDP-diacylglycerol diphosphatase [Steroidobacteraceae bacterium]|nr:CDP-diacylglycerol diphosphatase [Steroidobacteraceae bacterium]